MWREFNEHFKNPKREQGKQINHHDFLDPSFLSHPKDQGLSRRTFFSNIGGQSLDKNVQNTYGDYPAAETAVDLGRTRLEQTK